MKRYLWALCIAWLVWLGVAASAGAVEIHVCVRPPDVPANVGRWAYDGNKQVIVKSAEEFRNQSKGSVVFVYDPQAPPDSVSLLPARHQHLTCPAAKPSPPKPPPATSALPSAAPKPSGGGTGAGQGGTGKGTSGEKKSAGEKLAAELAIAGAIATGQMNEDLKNPTGKKHGIPGGKNPTGPNNPVAQAAAGVVLIVAGVLTQAGFEAKLQDALQKKTTLFLTENTLSKETLEILLAGKNAKYFAEALRENGTIGPYTVMSKFTAKLGGQWQAHHILEKRMFERFKLGKADLGPSVILTDVQHKRFTKLLKEKTADAATLEELWAGYKVVYEGHPRWLKAIESYFKKKK